MASKNQLPVGGEDIIGRRKRATARLLCLLAVALTAFAWTGLTLKDVLSALGLLIRW